MDHLVQNTPDFSSPANAVIWKVTLDRDWHRGVHGHTQCVHHLYRYGGVHRNTQVCTPPVHRHRDAHGHTHSVHHLCTGTACAQTHTQCVHQVDITQP